MDPLVTVKNKNKICNAQSLWSRQKQKMDDKQLKKKSKQFKKIKNLTLAMCFKEKKRKNFT